MPLLDNKRERPADATHLGFIYTFSCHGPGSVILCVYVFGLLIIVYLIL